jgi:hypothetical protein
MKSLIPLERVESRILLMRGEKVIIDADLAELYGVTTKALNHAIKRNSSRFPSDFLFTLTPIEKGEVVTNCDHLHKLKFSKSLPHAFTEHGALMAANVLNSDRAVEASVQVVRAFVKLRQILASNAELSRKSKIMKRSTMISLKIVFDAIKKLMTPESPTRAGIGFI